jgi:hypothetical protein
MSRSSKDASEFGLPIDKDPFQVTLEPEDDPLNLSNVKKWITVLVISSASLCVTCSSSIVSFHAWFDVFPSDVI